MKIWFRKAALASCHMSQFDPLHSLINVDVYVPVCIHQCIIKAAYPKIAQKPSKTVHGRRFIIFSYQNARWMIKEYWNWTRTSVRRKDLPELSTLPLPSAGSYPPPPQLCAWQLHEISLQTTLKRTLPQKFNISLS